MSDIEAKPQPTVQSGPPVPSNARTGLLGTTTAFRIAIICAFGCAIAFALALHRTGATFFRGQIFPADNDAFYHARRILDAVAGNLSIQQFDPRIHAPEGVLVPWPWGYDLGVAAIVKMLVGTGVASDPLMALVYVPVFAVIPSILLVCAIARQSGLGTATTAMLVLFVAMSPMTQALHGLGSVDHHFAEFLFISGFLAAALAWLRKPRAPGRSAVVGIALGLAPAIHTLLFILQVPLVVTLAILWIRKQPPDRKAIGYFCVSLAIATALAVLPSLPLREGHFEHYYLGWFHVYVALCVIFTVTALTHLKPGTRGYIILGVMAVTFTLPLLPQIQHASGYLADNSGVLSAIAEAKSVWSMAVEDPAKVLSIFSWLILLIPILIVGSIIVAARSERPEIILLCVFGAMSLAMLLAQFRFYYYGLIPMFLLPLLAVEYLRSRYRSRRHAVIGTATLAVLMAAAFFPAARSAFASHSVPGREPYFALTQLAMPPLAHACQQDPGIVLAKNNEGNYIRYFTECSVIANNFLISPGDIKAIYTMASYFAGTPADVLNGDIPVKYILVRARGAVALKADSRGFMVVGREDARQVSDPLTDALLWADPSSVDPAFELIAEIPVPTKDYPYARIWKVRR